MAEFQEVMRQYNRMCKKTDDCSKCQMSILKNPAKVRCGDLPYREPEYFEKTAMSWAAEHPEHVYPSWQEAWKQLFPHGQGSPCPAAYDMEFEPEDCAEISCAECKARHMHAKVAEKLGVKPVEVRRDA